MRRVHGGGDTGAWVAAAIAAIAAVVAITAVVVVVIVAKGDRATDDRFFSPVTK